MNKNALLSIAALIILAISACGPPPPTEQEIKSRFTGLYCNGTNRLEINEDATFLCSRVKKSFLSNKPMTEVCRGDYEWVFEEEPEQWKIVFTKTSGKNSLANCSGERVLWTKEGSWTAGPTEVSIPELFEEKNVVKGTCETL